ncbi:MAG: M15 family metallopeptidase, partial [Candidatus Cloacimonadota bacterium]|nr:M15 family metallopeptidase [Candidatus Cloacimonadota bacterium]
DIKNSNNNDNFDETKNDPVETSNDFLAMLTEEDSDDIFPNEDSREFKEKETLEDKNISVEKSNFEAEKDETVAVTEPDKVDDFENEYQQIIDEFSKEDDLSKYDNILSNDNDSESNTDVESFSLEDDNQEELDEINDLDSKLVKDLIDNFDFIANDSADNEDSYAKKSEETNEDTPESEQSDIDDNQNSDLNNTEIEENKQNSSTFENQNKSSDEDDIEDILNLSDSDLTNLISNENDDNDISAETQESVPKEDISDEASKTISGNTLPVAKQTDEEITSKDIKEKQDIYEPLEDDLSDSENIKLKNDNDYQEGQISKNKEIDKKEGALIISEKKSKSMDQNDEDVELEVKKDISDSKDKPIIEDSKTEFIQDKEIESQKLSEQKISEEEALKNRRILYWAMIEEGFENYPDEWWHYSFGDQMWAMLYGNSDAYYSCIEM